MMIQIHHIMPEACVDKNVHAIYPAANKTRKTLSDILYCPKGPDGSLWWGHLCEEPEQAGESIAFDQAPAGEFFKWEWMEERGWKIVPVVLVETSDKKEER